jgi:hypothetical protein
LEKDKWIDDHYENKRDMEDENEDEDEREAKLEVVFLNG